MDNEIKAMFDTRREAELATEHLIQEHGLNRTDIFIQPEGEENSAGATAAGADMEASLSEPRKEDKPKLAGKLCISVGCDSTKTRAVREALKEAGGSLV